MYSIEYYASNLSKRLIHPLRHNPLHLQTVPLRFVTAFNASPSLCPTVCPNSHYFSSGPKRNPRTSRAPGTVCTQDHVRAASCALCPTRFVNQALDVSTVIETPELTMDLPALLKHCMNVNEPLILDGGLATELEAQGANLKGDPLWSARLLHTNPQAIRDAHYRFLLSGADVITTATYQASVSGFMNHLNMSRECARELLMSAVTLAKESVERLVSKRHPAEQMHPLVAGSVGSYGAFLLDGSEYTGAYAAEMSVEEFKDWHRPQIECLSAAGADLLAFETIPSIKEAEAVVELLREFPDSKAWLSFSCKDEKRIPDGSPFTNAVQIANRSTQLVAVGVNCCSPLLVEPTLGSALSLRSPDMSWVVYPNSGEEWVREQGWLPSDKASTSLADLSRTWMKQGAAMIGGCCRIGPAQIAELRQCLKGGCASPVETPL